MQAIQFSVYLYLFIFMKYEYIYLYDIYALIINTL